jgi:competence protein ComEA
MWQALKDFFSFSRKDLRGIYVLLAILTVLLLFRIFSPFYFSNPEPDFTEFDRMVLALEKAERAVKEKEIANAKVAVPAFNRPDKEIAEIKLNPFSFDPNQMTEEAWLKLGLNMRQIRNIQNFTGSGGSFRKPADFKRMYSISDEEYAILEPFIVIAESEKLSEKEEFKKSAYKPFDSLAYPAKSNIIVNINTADSIELIKVRGIGPVFARRILQYRERLGGFHSPGQLMEVYGLDSARYELIVNSFSFDQSALRMIDVNTAEVKDLTAHPYIDFYLAKSIVDQRVKNGSYQSDAELYSIPLMHDALYQKVVPYFKFN